jgi:FAD-linked sulfhydryl oxidase
MLVVFAVLIASGLASHDLDESVMTREELGRHGWAILHEMAAYYPKEPETAYNHMTYYFLKSFAKLYPCKECSIHF